MLLQVERNSYTFIFLLSLVCCIACEEELGRDYGSEHETLLAVAGAITDEMKAHEVNLSFTSTGQDTFMPATGAQVVISSGSETFTLAEVSPGRYVTDSTVKGEVGKRYTLTIQYEGKTYQGSDEMLPVQDFDIIGYRLDDPQRMLYELEVPQDEFGTGVASKWVLHIERNIEGRTPPPGRQLQRELEFTYFTHPRLETHALFRLEESFTNLGLDTGSVITQTRHSMSDAYYEYIRSMLTITEWTGGYFDTPPANVLTNMSEGATGFFNASAVWGKTEVVQ